jgi:hypothetical protein
MPGFDYFSVFCNKSHPCYTLYEMAYMKSMKEEFLEILLDYFTSEECSRRRVKDTRHRAHGKGGSVGRSKGLSISILLPQMLW